MRNEDQWMSFAGEIKRTYEESTPWWPAPRRLAEGTPNIVFVVLDDVGYADLSCFGSELETPVFDSCAQRGLRYTNFHTTTLCSASRACLLTGRNHHTVGMRMLSNLDTGFPSGRGRITRQAVLLPEILREHGFSTMAVGKWHLAPTEETSAAGPFGEWPLGRGFERYYGFLEAEADHFNPELVYDNHIVMPPKSPEEGYHLSEDLVDRAIGFIRDQTSVTPDKPFFLYLAFGTAHAPHHAPAEFLERCRGRYDEGWDVVRQRRFERQLEMGIVPQGTALTPRNPGVVAWEEVPEAQRRMYCRMQEAYAAMIEHTDRQFGRLLGFLGEVDRLDNTIVVILSDNGASQEGGQFGSLNPTAFQNRCSEDIEANVRLIDQIGGPNVHSNYPWGWAQASNTPFKWYKQNTHEGGVHGPLIVRWDRVIDDRGGLRRQFHHVTDIYATVLEVLGLEDPATWAGVPQLPPYGTSMKYSFHDALAPTRKEVQYFEMYGHRGLWLGGWKAVTYHTRGRPFEEDVWELYNLEEDLSEVVDLAGAESDRLKSMVQRFWTEAEVHGVLPLDDQGFAYRSKVPRPGSPRDRERFVYYPGMAHLPMAVSPPVMDRGHRISVPMSRSSSEEEGVLVALGNVSSGYVLYVMGNLLHYEYNFIGSHYVIASERELPDGSCIVEFTFDKTGPGRGVGTLSVDGSEIGRGVLPRVLPHFLGWAGLDVGKDSLSRVSSNYADEFAFEGKIEKVIFTIDDFEPAREYQEVVD